MYGVFCECGSDRSGAAVATLKGQLANEPYEPCSQSPAVKRETMTPQSQSIPLAVATLTSQLANEPRSPSPAVKSETITPQSQSIPLGAQIVRRPAGCRLACFSWGARVQTGQRKCSGDHSRLRLGKLPWP